MEQAQASDEAVWGLRSHTASPEAFAQFVRTHEAAVRGLLARALRDLSAADDLAQEVFLFAYQRMDEYRGEGTVRAWLLGVARNLALQHVRSSKRRRAREEGPLQVELARWRMERLADDPWDAADQEQTFTALRDCVDRLAPESRRVVEEHYYQRHTIEAIARRMGRAGGAVRMLLFRIRHALNDCLRSKVVPRG